MMKDHDVSKLTESIDSCIEGVTGEVSPDVLASMYATECREVNKRLATIASMMQSGGDMEALQVAEAQPRLMDRAELLSFGREAEWHEYCSDHSFEQAPDIDVDTLDALKLVYDRKISPKHRLYKDFRAAVHSRDERQAFNLIQLITRLNPSDKNAKSELKRMRHKMAVSLLAKIEEALDNDNDNEVELLGYLDELEQPGSRDEYEESQVYQNAIKRRLEYRRKCALDALPQQLAAAASILDNEEDWLRAAKIHAEAAANIAQYKLALTPEQQGLNEEIGHALKVLRSEAERQAKISQYTNAMVRIAEDVEIEAVTPHGLNTSYADQSLSKLLNYEVQLKKLGADLQAVDRSRITAAKDQLAQILERHRIAKKTRLILMLTLTSVFLVILAVLGWLFMQASEEGKILVGLQSSGQSMALEKQIDAVKSEKTILLKFPSLSAQLAISEQWLVGVHATAKQAGLVLNSLEKEAQLGFIGKEAKAVHADLCELDDLFVKLPEDLRKESDARIIILRNAVDEFLSDQQAKVAMHAEQVISELEEILADMNPSTPAIQCRETLRYCTEKLEPYTAMAEEEDSELRLPKSTEVRVAALKHRVDDLLTSADATIEARYALDEADTIDEYAASIIALSDMDFGEAHRAQKVLDVGLPSEQTIRAKVLFRGDMDALKIVEGMDLDEVPMPKLADDNDFDILAQLTNSKSLSDIYRIGAENYGNSHIFYIKGELQELQKDDKNIGWKMNRVIEPERQINDQDLDIKPFEMKIDKGWKLLERNLSEVSVLHDSLRLDQILNEGDEGAAFTRSLVSLLDTVYTNNNVPVLAKAHVLGEIAKLIRGRQRMHDWGVYLIPELAEDLDVAGEMLDLFPLRAADWLYAEITTDPTKKIKKEEKKWLDYFEKRKNRRHFRKLRTRQALFMRGIKSPVKIAGITTNSEMIKLPKSYFTRVLLGHCINDDGVGELRVIGVVKKDQEALTLPDNILLSSAIYSMEIINPEGTKEILRIHGLAEQ